jgi:hypothetical protein
MGGSNTNPFGYPTAASVLAKLDEHTREDREEFRLVRDTQADHGRELGVQTAILTRLEAVVVNGQVLEQKRAQTAIEVAGEKTKVWWNVVKAFLIGLVGLGFTLLGYFVHKWTS